MHGLESTRISPQGRDQGVHHCALQPGVNHPRGSLNADQDYETYNLGKISIQEFFAKV